MDSIKLNLLSEYSIKVSALHDIYRCHKVAFYDNVAQNYAKQIMLLLPLTPPSISVEKYAALISLLKGHSGWVYSLTVLPNGRLVSGADDTMIEIWDVGCRPALEKESAKDKKSDTITMDFKSPQETKPIKEGVTPPESFKTMTPTLTLPSISAGEYVALTSQIEHIKSAVKTSEKDLSEELQILQEHIKTMNNEVQWGLTAEEKQRLQIRITEDRVKESLLMERQTILMTPHQRDYYETLQMHISELMVVSLGVGSGYVAINNSKGAQAVGWVCTAISSAFPGASLVTSVVNSGVSYLDSKYREWVLERIRVFGTTIKDAEALGEEVARLLVRAHYYAELPLSRKKADKDAQVLITAIVKANPPMIRDEDAVQRLFEIVWGNTAQCTEPLPIESSQKSPARPPEPLKNQKVSLATPLTQLIHLTLTNPESSPELNQSPDAQTLTQQLTEKDKEILQMKEELAQIKSQIGNLATKSEVVSRQEMAPPEGGHSATKRSYKYWRAWSNTDESNSAYARY